MSQLLSRLLRLIAAMRMCCIDCAMARKQNPIAKNLRTPLYRKRVVSIKTVYDRKKYKLSEMRRVILKEAD